MSDAAMEKLTEAILDDRYSTVDRLLKTDGTLVCRLYTEARLHESKIFHWIYIGDTALHLATAGYRVEIVQRLLAAKADPNAAENHRRSGPLHYAADGYLKSPSWNEKKQVETIRLLLDAGADINAQDKNGATPLHRAVRTRCAAAVRCLLNAGADPLMKNKPGSSPFHLAVQDTGRGGSGDEAARAGQREIISEFLSRGVSIYLTDEKGKSVLESARSGWIQKALAEKATPIQ